MLYVVVHLPSIKDDLDAAQGTGKPVNMEEEFRLLTLQVIGEAILGLHHDECDEVGTAQPHYHQVLHWHRTHGIAAV
jgi:cytochrome P450